MGRRSKYSPEFKAKVAIEALKEHETLQDLAVKFKITPSKITSWKNELSENSKNAFIKQKKVERKTEKENNQLYEKIGRLQTEVDFFAQACKDAGLRTK